ncbi:MAG: hypothetical protein KatS3mg131_3374 [Candidatus Tectimicrobiota bacterium]|nr:MAG: hypothetical protein KatS3mg131_3374 [Candidatus Tectomicrobia bacterium]
MTLTDHMEHLIELVAHIAQQVQGERDTRAQLGYLRRILQGHSDEAGLLNALITSLDVPQLRRLLHRTQPSDTPTPAVVPGKRITLYKATLPGEPQARVAADSLIARYLNWLARNPHRRAVTLVNTERHVVLFVPEGSEFNSEKAWCEFVTFVFSGEELERTFVAMLNSIKLSERGFGVPEFPIISEDQLLIVLAWLLRSVQSAEQRLRRREVKIAELEKNLRNFEIKEQSKIKRDIETLKKNQNKEVDKYEKNFKRKFNSFIENQDTDKKRKKSKIELPKHKLLECMELFDLSGGNPFEFLRRYEDKHLQSFNRIRPLMAFFTERAAQQINLTRGDNLANAVVEIVRLTTWLESTDSDEIGAIRARKLKLQPLLSENPGEFLKRSPGDGTGEFCYVCGRRLASEDKTQVNRFVFRSPSQRLQSVRGEQRPPVCRHCVAIAFACPLKPSDQSVIIRLSPALQDGWKGGHSAAVLGELEAFLRGLTLSQLDLAAGNYLMLTSSERVKVGKRWRYLADVIGAVPYAYLRLADTFEYQVFDDYVSRIVTGISDIELAPHRLAFLSILIRALQLRLTEGSDVNRPLATAIRYVLADEPILAIYELVSQPNIDQRCRQERVRIEIERSLEVWMQMTRAEMIGDIVAMAGLLYPFVDQTLREMRKRSEPELDPDREASKLIEEVDEVFNFLYRFTNNTTYSTTRLYRNPTNWFTYEKTKKLLEKIGVDINEREKNEGNYNFIEINVNDVEAAYRFFSEKIYKNDADWRSFTYRLKLALYSRFPGLGVKREQSR